MKRFHILLIGSLIAAASPAQAAVNDDEGWPAFGHALTLVQMFVRLAAQSDDPRAGLNAVDDILAGRSTEANRAIAGLFEEATADMPPEYRGKLASIGHDLAAMARREAGRPAALLIPSPNASADRALQARKDLTAMGLSYHDPKQFLDAVSRDDMLAVELFVAGRGVNLSTTDWRGRNAVEIARANGNAPLAELLARNLPAAR